MRLPAPLAVGLTAALFLASCGRSGASSDDAVRGSVRLTLGNGIPVVIETNAVPERTTHLALFVRVPPGAVRRGRNFDVVTLLEYALGNRALHAGRGLFTVEHETGCRVASASWEEGAVLTVSFANRQAPAVLAWLADQLARRDFCTPAALRVQYEFLTNQLLASTPKAALLEAPARALADREYVAPHLDRPQPEELSELSGIIAQAVSPANLSIHLVGNVNPSSMQPLLESSLGRLPSALGESDPPLTAGGEERTVPRPASRVVVPLPFIESERPARVWEYRDCAELRVLQFCAPLLTNYALSYRFSLGNLFVLTASNIDPLAACLAATPPALLSLMISNAVDQGLHDRGDPARIGEFWFHDYACDRAATWQALRQLNPRKLQRLAGRIPVQSLEVLLVPVESGDGYLEPRTRIARHHGVPIVVSPELTDDEIIVMAGLPEDSYHSTCLLELSAALENAVGPGLSFSQSKLHLRLHGDGEVKRALGCLAERLATPRGATPTFISQYTPRQAMRAFTGWVGRDCWVDYQRLHLVGLENPQQALSVTNDRETIRDFTATLLTRMPWVVVAASLARAEAAAEEIASLRDDTPPPSRQAGWPLLAVKDLESEDRLVFVVRVDEGNQADFHVPALVLADLFDSGGWLSDCGSIAGRGVLTVGSPGYRRFSAVHTSLVFELGTFYYLAVAELAPGYRTHKACEHLRDMLYQRLGILRNSSLPEADVSRIANNAFSDLSLGVDSSELWYYAATTSAGWDDLCDALSLTTMAGPATIMGAAARFFTEGSFALVSDPALTITEDQFETRMGDGVPL